MANEDHVMILRCGVKVWNRWRGANPESVPDLDKADLRNANLSHANLSNASILNADLSNANLANSNLSKSNLERANFRSSDLASANLSDTNLMNSHFTFANLDGANLSYARLGAANLANANLTDANLTSAELHGVTFTGANLARANLGRADLSFTDLRRARLEGTNLDASRLAGVLTENLSSPSASLDRAFIGDQFSALEPPLFREDLDWKICFFGNRDDFDPDHDPGDPSYWLHRRNNETIFRAAARAVAGESPNSIHLTFQKSVWRDLVVIETGLREHFGADIETKKADGALTVSFQSTEDLQRGLETVFIQLAAKYAEDQQPVDSLLIQGKNEEQLALSSEDLLRGFEILHRKMESVEDRLPAPKPELTDNQETLARMSESVPFFKWFSHRFRKWLTQPGVKAAGEVPVRQLFNGAREGFRWSQSSPLRLEDGIEDAEILEEREDVRLLGDGRRKE